MSLILSPSSPGVGNLSSSPPTVRHGDSGRVGDNNPTSESQWCAR